ncbi:MAG: ComEC/Rec2 family competence protein [Candidatus Magasanikbacteria bacterium]|nr:ComEC/Rec2 family competence protein [Candidatus Magasanikbacteria bacterium]
MFQQLIHSKSKSFFSFCLCFLLGVSIISIYNGNIETLYVVVSSIVLSVFVGVYWRAKTARFLLLSILFFALGFLRFQLTIPHDTVDNIIHYAGEKKTIVGFVSAEPDVRMDGVRYIVQSSELLVQRDEPKVLEGKLYFKSSLYPRYEYGDKLELKCDLQRPELVEGVKGTPQRDFAYDKYLARYGVYVLCQDARVTKIGVGEGNRVLSGIFALKNVVADRISTMWHEPYASFMAGLLYGYRGGLGELNELFSRTGVTHIVAISGYNITLIATILINFCIYLYIPRKKAFWVITIGIVVFVIFAGASASVVRAGVMGIIVLLSKQIGRASRVGNVMILTAVVMTLQNPYILMWDAGFQLSFLATLGLVYLNPIIRKPFQKYPEILGIKETLITTIAAIMATLPLILFQFGRLSIVAPAVNIMILWILPMIMAFGFFAVVISFIFKPLAMIIAWLGWVGMEYIVVIVKWFANLKFSAVDMQVPVWGMVGMYIGLIGWIILKGKAKNGKMG